MNDAASSFLSLGSNIGDKEHHLRTARQKIAAEKGIELVAVSPLYRTRPVGKTDQDWFLNQVVQIETTLSPYSLLAVCQKIESESGRVRAERWGPRTFDIDILVYDQINSDDPTLTLPHPRLHERAFVLVPLADIAADLEIGQQRVKDYLEALPLSEREGVEPFQIGSS